MISAELFGALEYIVKGAVRAHGTYKKRRNGGIRVFGGVSLVMCADFCQLHPVTGTFIASDPAVTPAGRAQNAQLIFWEDGPGSIRSFWDLRELMRCSDVWYNSFLSECREGKLSINNYCFLHGLPSFTCPCESCTCNDDVEIDPLLGAIKSNWKQRFLKGDCHMAEVVRETEANCSQCAHERQRRHRVLNATVTDKQELQQEPYSSAPALYAFNVPRYFSTNLRAREFAKQTNVQLSWCYAKDIPLYPGDRDLKDDALRAKLFTWLRKHDQQTSHLPSIYALAIGMPIRLTESVDRDRGLYRGRKGSIFGWTMAPGCIPERWTASIYCLTCQ